MAIDGPRAGWFNLEDKLFLCFESGTDADFNDIISEIEGGIEPIPFIPEFERDFYTFCFEDRELGDYDLNDVVIKAINIEKAFLSLEFRNIDKLLSCLNGKVWSEFVNNNLQVINAAEYNNLEAEQECQMSRQNILKDIKNLLDQMNNSSTNTVN